MALLVLRGVSAVALFSCILLAACSSRSETAKTSATSGKATTEERKPAPEFSLKDADGRTVSLAGYRGKVVLLNFWATWCGPCKAEIPSLVELQAQYGDDLVILGVSVDDPVEKMRPYAAQYKINYPLLVGDGREDVQDAFGPLFGVPVSVIIGRDGRIAKKHSGIATKGQIEREIKALL